jgi:hypothetical protein
MGGSSHFCCKVTHIFFHDQIFFENSFMKNVSALQLADNVFVTRFFIFRLGWRGVLSVHLLHILHIF